jgi:PBP1b-binding outer membrane lipoprotein LpoB
MDENKLMKKKIIIAFIILTIIFSGCVTINIYQHPVKQYQNYTEQDTVKIESWY